MKKLIKLAAVAAMLTGTLALAPTAQAHEANVTALVCQVNGSVTTDFSNYRFVDSSIECNGLYEGVLSSGTYAVEAGGSTTSNLGSTPINSDGSETCDEGKSAAPGSLVATRVGSGTGNAPAGLVGDVTFVRSGTVVEANGTLTDDNGHDVVFVAELQFTPFYPAQLTDCDAATSATPAQLDASLIGVAEITDAP